MTAPSPPSVVGSTVNEPFVFDTPEKIEGCRLLMLRSAVGLELKGIRVWRHTTAYVQIKRQFGLKGTRQRVFDQFTQMLREKGILV